MKQKICVLVNSCDKYEDVWMPFFHFFNKHWKNCPYKVFLNTEQKKCKIDNIVTINSKPGISWSLRLKKALKKTNSKYVIFFLEDFFLLKDVDQSMIETVISYMDNNRDISTFRFYPNKQLLSVNDGLFEGFEKRDLNGKWWLSCQVAIWRTNDLIKYLNPYEDPWQFEEYGTNMAKLYNKRFYNSIDWDHSPFLYSVNRENGFGLYAGQWLKSNIELFKKEKLEIDFSGLGLCGNEANKPFVCIPSKKALKERIMFLLYGIDQAPFFLPIRQFLKICIQHPKHGLSIIKVKLKFCFLNSYNKSR